MIALHHFQFRAMGSPCSLRIYVSDPEMAQRALQWVKDEVERLEQKYSRYRADSLLSKINHLAGSGPQMIEDEETCALLDYAQQAWQQSEGMFDLSSGLIQKLWDFKNLSLSPKALPSAEAVDEVLTKVGWQRIRWHRPELILPSGMQLDFGGCVKEYAADSAARLLALRFAQLNVEEAGPQQSPVSALVELGGDIAVTGPALSNEPWRIGLKHPRGEGAIYQLGLSSGALASSGDYERCFEIDGQRYSHVLNPKTAWPARGPAAVSVIADACILAGTAATVAMSLEEDASLEWLNSLELPYFWVGREGEIRNCL